MKSITYDFDWWHIFTGLVDLYGLEDGFWQVTMNTECVTIPFPAPVVGAREAILPGHLVRITGLQLKKVPNLGFMCFEVEGGGVINGFDTNQRGPKESSGIIGENSGSAPDGD